MSVEDDGFVPGDMVAIRTFHRGGWTGVYTSSGCEPHDYFTVRMGSIGIVITSQVDPLGDDMIWLLVVDGRVGWASDVNVVGTGDEGKGDYFVWDR